MSSVLPEPTMSEDDLLLRRIEVLRKRSRDENPFMRRLAKQKLREFSSDKDVSALLGTRIIRVKKS